MLVFHYFVNPYQIKAEFTTSSWSLRVTPPTWRWYRSPTSRLCSTSTQTILSSIGGLILDILWTPYHTRQWMKISVFLEYCWWLNGIGDYQHFCPKSIEIKVEFKLSGFFNRTYLVIYTILLCRVYYNVLRMYKGKSKKGNYKGILQGPPHHPH